MRTALWPRAAALAPLAFASPILAGEPIVDVIYTKIPGHPTAVIPGALDANGDPTFSEFRSMEDLVGSPDGSIWLLDGRTQLGSDLETILLLGSGERGTMFAQEGQPVPGGAPGEVFDFFGSGLGRFNDLGQLAYSARARGGVAGTLQKVILYTGKDSAIVYQQGDPWNGLMDLPPNPSGDELVGNSVGSIHLLNDGTIGAQDSTIQNIHSSRRPAIFYDQDMFHQTNVTTVTGMDGVSEHLWESLDSNSFYTTPDGKTWAVIGRIAGVPDTQDIVFAVNGMVQLQEGSSVTGEPITMADVFNFNLLANGDWYARGDDTADDDWAARNGELLAATGDPVSGGAKGETLGDVFSAFTGNASGDWVLFANTTSADLAADNVVLFNGEVVLREGDPVDLDGNGEFDDDVFIGRGNDTLTAWSADNAFLTSDGVLYAIVNIRDGEGNDLNGDPSFGTPAAFVRIDLGGAPACPADLNNSGDVNAADLALLLGNWNCADDCIAELNGTPPVNAADLALLLGAWGDCPAK